MSCNISKNYYIALLSSIVLLSLYWLWNADINAQSADTITLYGNVDTKDVVLGFRVSGRVQKMNCGEGELVKPGQILAELDKEPFEAEYMAAEAVLASATVEYSNALRKYERTSVLLKTRNISREEYDNALTQRKAKQADIKVAEARLKLAQINLNDAVIKAPVEGIITSRIREPGTIVASGLPVYTMMPIEPVSIRGYIDEVNLGHVYVGQKVKILTDSGSVYFGVIGFISPQAEFTPKTVETLQLRPDLVYRIKVVIEQPAPYLHQGMPVTLQVMLGASDAAKE